MRIDQDLLDVIDEIAADTGETRTDVMLAALERGLVGEQDLLAFDKRTDKVPVFREMVEVLEKAGAVEVFAKMLGREVDRRRLGIRARIRKARRGSPGNIGVKPAEG